MRFIVPFTSIVRREFSTTHEVGPTHPKMSGADSSWSVTRNSN